MSRDAVGPTSNLWWPAVLPSSNLDFTLPLADVQYQGDSVSVATLALEPSGTGERQAIDLSVDGYTLTAQLTGGVPGRIYRNQITITGVSGRIWQYVVSQLVSWNAALPPVYPLPPAPAPGFGPVITYSSGATVFGPAIAAVATGVVGTGTTQSTAFPLAAAVNIVASAPAGTGFILPVSIVSGTIVVQDDDASNVASTYPPVGAQINALGENMPFLVGPGQRISFSTSSPSTQWWAA